MSTIAGRSPEAPGVSYRQAYRKCGKPRCGVCATGPGHGPYWYASWREGNRVRTRYLGKTLPSEPVDTLPIAVRCLSGLSVSLANGQKLNLNRKPRDLFTLLLSAPDEGMHREEVSDSLWPEADPISGNRNLWRTVLALRDALGRKEWVIVNGPRVRLALPAGARDDTVFEQLASGALRDRGLARLTAAIELYSGPYLPDDRYSDWTAYRRFALHDLWRDLVLAACDTVVAGGTAAEALPWLRELTRHDACDEVAARRLMQLLMLLGERIETIRVYRTLVASLETELDTVPEDATIALYDVARGGAC